MTQVTPNEIMKTWPMFKVARQHKDGDNIIVQTVRAPHPAAMMDLVRRIAAPTPLEELAFFEVHELLPGDKVKIIHGDISKGWPRAPREERTGIISPKPTTQEDLEWQRALEASRKRTEPAALPKKNALVKATEAIVSMRTKQPDELGRQVKSHKQEVA